jgi:RNA exonuclease 4
VLDSVQASLHFLSSYLIPYLNQQVVGVHQVNEHNKKQRRRRRKNQKPENHSDDSTCTTLSSDASEVKPKRRRRARKQKKSQLKSPDEPHLSLEEQSQYVALDCEMVGVGRNGQFSSVARVTLVGWDGEVIMDEHVKQEQEVTDYRTFVSGITEEDIAGANLTCCECTERVSQILEGKVLVGHALKNDMKALHISHPWHMTRDTAKYEPFMQVRFDDCVLWPRKLKDLVKQKLNRDIQTPGRPHSAYEDALAALDLYRCARKKWEKAMDYKIKKTQEIQNL